MRRADEPGLETALGGGGGIEVGTTDARGGRTVAEAVVGREEELVGL